MNKILVTLVISTKQKFDFRPGLCLFWLSLYVLLMVVLWPFTDAALLLSQLSGWHFGWLAGWLVGGGELCCGATSHRGAIALRRR